VPQRPLPDSALPAFERLARRVSRAAAPDGPPPSTLVVGPATPRLLAAVSRALTPRLVQVDDLAAAPDGLDVVVAPDWIARQDDPDAAVAALGGLGAAHLLLGAPSRPLAVLVAAVTRRPRPGVWTGSGFLRAASAAGGVREVAHPRGWTFVWVRRN